MIGKAFSRFILSAVGEEMFLQIMRQLKAKISGKVAEKLQKRVEKMLGADTEQARKDITDEIIYNMVIAHLTDTQVDQVDAFEAQLRRTDKEKAEAFVLFIATVVTKFPREVRKTTGPKKGESGPTLSESYTDFSKGVEYAKKILEALVRVTGANEEETFSKRQAFLEGKNVFSLIKPKKGTTEFEKMFTNVKTSFHNFFEERGGVRASIGDVACRLEDVAASYNSGNKFTQFLKKYILN